MATQTYQYSNEANYTYNSTKVEFLSGKAQLKLLESSGLTYTEDFANDTGHTYDSAKAEFTGGLVRQKEQIANSKFASKFTSSIDATWVVTGTTTASQFGTPSIVSNKLQCHGAHGIRYDDVDSENVSAGAFKFRYTPNYTTGPAANIDIFNLRASGGGNNDRLGLSHSPSGNTLRMWLYNNVGTNIYLATAIGAAWNPTSGTEYEFELNWDPSGGVIRLFINGVLHGTLSPGAWTRGTAADRVAIGAISGGYGTANATFDDCILYSAVQHTSGYTPGYSIDDTRFLASNVVTPEFEHTQPGSILSLDGFDSTESGSPRYTIQLDQSGDYLYWNGAAWVVSDETFAQANTEAEINTNIAALDVDGDNYLQVQVHFDNTNTQASVDNIDIDHTAHTGYPTDNPTVITNDSFYANDGSAFSTIQNSSGSDAVTHVVIVNGTDYWWNGAAWATSSGYAESNSAADINTNIGTLITVERSVIALKTYLHSDDGSTTPDIDESEFTFTPALPDPNLPTAVLVHGFLYDHQGARASSLIKIRPYLEGHVSEGVFLGYDYQDFDTTNSDGYFQGLCFASETNKFWEFKIEKQRYKVSIPDQASVDFSTLTIEAIEE